MGISRAILAIGCEFQCRMQDSSIEYCHGVGSHGHVVIPNAIVPLHSTCGSILYYYLCHARSYRL
jgi:hypothetical protein